MRSGEEGAEGMSDDWDDREQMESAEQALEDAREDGAYEVADRDALEASLRSKIEELENEIIDLEEDA